MVGGLRVRFERFARLADRYQQFLRKFNKLKVG